MNTTSKRKFITVLDYNKGEAVTYDVSAYKGVIDDEYAETLMEDEGHNGNDCYWMEHTNYHEDLEYETDSSK